MPPAVPLSVMPALLKPLTGSLKTAVKLIGEALVGSAWPAAWLIVTEGGVVSPTTVKLLALLAVPLGAMTPIEPVVAPAGTVAVIVVAEPTVKLALVPLNSTAVAPVKFVPLIVTLVPTGPLAGAKLVIVGGLETVTVTGSDVHSIPSESLATAVSACEPLLAVVV